MKIGINTKVFDGWGGGIDFIRHITSCLEYANQDNTHDISLLLAKNDIIFYSKKYLHPFKTLVRSWMNNDPLTWTTWQGFDQNYLESTFSDFKTIAKIFPGYTLKSHLTYAKKLPLDVVLPCAVTPPRGFNVPWVGYIYDFQHKYLPHLFNEHSIKSRNQSFSQMLEQAKHVIVNAHSVKYDAKKFLGDFKAKIHVLPYSPSPQIEWLYENRDLRQKYGITKPYFIICNQFWKHKNHTTAFKAFQHFLSNEGKSFQLVCTGAVDDFRDREYFKGLKILLQKLGLIEDVIILGHIPKLDQISLLKRSIAVIQPTLFEGGPGGGASYDAISLGHPLIVSDIPVNREIDKNDAVSFFKPECEEELTAKLTHALNYRFIRADNEILWSKGCLRKNRCGKKLLDIAKETTTSF